MVSTREHNYASQKVQGCRFEPTAPFENTVPSFNGNCQDAIKRTTKNLAALKKGHEN